MHVVTKVPMNKSNLHNKEKQLEVHVVTNNFWILATQSTEGFALQINISQFKLIFIVILGVIQKKSIKNGYQT